MNRTVKRVLALVAVLAVIMVMACACGSNKYIVTWTIESFTTELGTMSNSQYKSLTGNDLGTIEIKEEGFSSINLGESEIPATFEQDGDKATLKISESLVLDCSIENGKLKVEDFSSGYTYLCSK